MITRLRSPDAAARWLREWTTGTLRTDSREVARGDAFIAWPGASADGRRFVDAALRAGASTCLVEAAGVEAFGFDDARIGALPGLKAATGPIADAFFAHPTRRLRMIAATGTNGKTSTAWWVAQALTLLGQRCGVIGTLGIGEPPLGAAPAGFMPIVPTGRTTPDPALLHGGVDAMCRAGFSACAIEATSIGIVEHRLAGVHIDVALFTNFTRDHLDYHGSMDGYWAAKQRLFAWPGLRAAVVNLDDAQGDALAPALAERLDVWSYSLQRDDARLRARGLHYVERDVERHVDRHADHHVGPHADRAPQTAGAGAGAGLAFTLHEGAQALPVRSRLIGDYNAANLLAVIGALRALGVPLADAVAIVPRLTPVPGRMQTVGADFEGAAAVAVGAAGADAQGSAGAGRPLVVVDYAHTPDALEKALIALRPLAQARGGRLVCVFGCGGNRDASKRAPMGAIAERLADSVVLTSDNPRDEAPAAILQAVAAGFATPQRAAVIEDRGAAIAHAVRSAGAHDVLLIAGKGHETDQEVAGEKRPFSDVDEARRALAARRQADCATMTLGLLQRLLPGAVLHGDPATPIERVHSDTRTLRAGDLFVALRGERFDAHDFLPQARAAGAVAVLAERGLAGDRPAAAPGAPAADAESPGAPAADAALPGLQVADTRAALGVLGGAWRARFGLPLIAVAGSNGKTTVTQMVASILRAWLGPDGDRAFATAGNFNNDIGLPLTLLRLRASHRAGVVELGMNHPGEIAQLARLAAPTVALVNNAQREHQEFMATVEAAARENGAVIEALGADGTAVFPAADAHTPLWRALAAGRRTLTFGLDAPADVPGDVPAAALVAARAGAAGDAAAVEPSDLPPHASDDRRADVRAAGTWSLDHWAATLHTPAGSIAFTLRLPGRHNLQNAAAAAACALAAGCPLDAIGRGLTAFEPVAGRSQSKPLRLHGRAVTLIDDSYNANPDSVRAAIDVLAALPGPRWLVLGDMGEVGDQGPAFHAEVGAHARAAGIDALWAAGPASRAAAQAFGPAARHFDGVVGLIAALAGDNAGHAGNPADVGTAGAPPAASVVVKGSRFMRMETVVAALQAGGAAC